VKGYPSVVQASIVVAERSRYLNAMWSEFGLSMLLECGYESGETRTILFDTSTSGELLLRNLKALNTPVESIDYVVLSHAHYDHTGGLADLIEAEGSRFVLIAHPEILRPVYSVRRGLKFIGLEPEVLCMLPESRLLLAENSFEIIPKVAFSGTIRRQTDFEQPEVGVYTKQHGRFVEDPELDDVALVITLSEEEIAVVTGCSHAGVINTLLHAQQISGRQRVRTLAGGFHLVDLEQHVRDKTVDILEQINPESIYSGHCTGQNAERMLSSRFGERYTAFYTGDTFRL